jgi:predicted transcriptional regulator of viral defense system
MAPPGKRKAPRSNARFVCLELAKTGVITADKLQDAAGYVNKASASKILSLLTGQGFLKRIGHGRYDLGPRSWAR